MAEPKRAYGRSEIRCQLRISTGDSDFVYDQPLDPVGNHSRDLQLVIRHLFRAIQDIETSIRSVSLIAALGSRSATAAGSLTLGRSLDVGAPEINGSQSSAIALGGDHSVLLRGGHGD